MMVAISTTSMQAAIRMGLLVGATDALLIKSSPIFGDEDDKALACP